MSGLTGRALVTGASGFIGSHLTEALVREGADVTAFVHYRSSNRDGLLSLLDDRVRRSIRVVQGDLQDAQSVCRAVHGQRLVFHLGALIAIPYSYENPVHVVQTNVGGTANVLMAARDLGVERLVHTSTSEIYGTAQRPSIDESHPVVPQSPYAASKVGADALALAFHRSFDLPVVTVRPFNCYGPRQSARAVIPTIAAQALHGREIRLGSLAPTRDFTFVADTVRAFLAAAVAPGVIGTAINVGSGEEVSVGELAARIAALAGRDVPILGEDAARARPAASEVDRLLCDATRARTLLGWAPRVSLDDGLREVLAFLRAHPDWTRLEQHEV